MPFALEEPQEQQKQQFAVEGEESARLTFMKAIPRPIIPQGSMGETGVVNAITFLPRAAYATVAGALQLLADTAQGEENPEQYFSDNFNSAMDKLAVPEDERGKMVSELIAWPFTKAHEVGDKAAESVFEKGLPGTGGLASGSPVAATGISISGDVMALLAASVGGRAITPKRAAKPAEEVPSIEDILNPPHQEAWAKHQATANKAWDEYEQVLKSKTASPAEKSAAKEKSLDIEEASFDEYRQAVSEIKKRRNATEAVEAPKESLVFALEGEAPVTIEASATAGRFEELQAGRSVIPPIPPKPTAPAVEFNEPLFKPEVTPVISKGISDLAKEFFESNPEARDPRLLISDDIVRHGLSGKIPRELLDKHGLSGTQFSSIWRETITASAQRLAYLSQVERRLKLTPEEADILRKQGMEVDDGTVAMPMWKRLDNIRRGLLVTQLATAARNAETQAMRLSLDVMQAPIDAGIQKLTGRPQTVHPLDGMDQMIQVFKKNKDVVDKILEHHPKNRDRMLATYMSDIAAADKSATGAVVRGAEKAVDLLNWANKGQEFILRRAVFQANLSQLMRRNGLNLEEMIKKNEFDRIPKAEVEAAVHKALEVTFADTPEFGTARRAFIDLVNKTPGATLAIPFPRFMMNAMKFLWDYNPTGFLNYLSPKERAAFAAGDTSSMSKAIIGSGLLAAAFAFRSSDYAGEKWYEARTADGKIVDLRPFNPFATYLFVADVAIRSNSGNLHTLTAKDVVSGVLSTTLRAGTGLYLLDETLKSLSADAYSEEKWKRRVAEFTGEIAGGTLTPLATVRDLYAEFDANSRQLKDTRQEPFLGPIKRQIPGVSATLPEAQIPTREGPIEIIRPGLRQFTGISLSGPKNPIEKELDRLGFARYEVLKASGDKKLDARYAEIMGPIVEQVGTKIVQSGSYQNLTDAQKAVVLQHVVAEIRTAAKEGVNATLAPEEQVKRKLEHEPSRVKRMLREAGIPID